MADMSNNPGDQLLLQKILKDLDESIAKQEVIDANVTPMIAPPEMVTRFDPSTGEQYNIDRRADQEIQNINREAYLREQAAREAGPVPSNEALQDVDMNLVTGTRSDAYDLTPASTNKLREQVMSDLDESISDSPAQEGLDPARVRVRDYVAQRRGLAGPTMEDLQRAQGRAGTKRFLANLNRAAKDYIGTKSGVKMGTGLAKGLEAEATAEVQNIANQQKLAADKQLQEQRDLKTQSQELNLKKDQRANDPTSDISISMRELAQRAGLPVTVNMSAVEVEALFNRGKTKNDKKFLRIGKTPQGKTNYLWIGEDGTIEDTGVTAVTAGLISDPQTGEKKQPAQYIDDQEFQVVSDQPEQKEKPVFFGEPGKQKLKQPDFGQRGEVYFNPRQVKEFNKVQKDFNKATEKSKSQLDSGSIIMNAVGNERLDYALVRTQLPRLMGEVGNLAAFEQEVWEGDPDVFNRFSRFLRKNFSFDSDKKQWIGAEDGSLTPDDATAIREVVAAALKQRARRYLTTAKQAANQAQTFGIPRDYAEYRLLQDEPIFKSYVEKLTTPAEQEEVTTQESEQATAPVVDLDNLPERVTIRDKQSKRQKTVDRETAKKILQAENADKYEVVQ